MTSTSCTPASPTVRSPQLNGPHILSNNTIKHRASLIRSSTDPLATVQSQGGGDR
jgi:hypothetical protein